MGELVKVRVNPKYFHEIVKFIPYSHGDPIGRWSIFEARECCDGWFLYGKVFHKKVFDMVEEETDMYNHVGREGFDINSESDYDPNIPQPAGYTDYVVFKRDVSGEYGGKEYAYKCSFEDRRQASECHDVMYAEVNVSGVEKKVKVLRIEAKIDPKATKSITRILPKELAKDVGGSKLSTPKATLEAVNFVHDFKPNDFSITKEEIDMSNQNRAVSVKFFDDDAGLKAEDSLVASYEVVTRVSDQMTISKVLLTENVAEAIAQHNEKRENTIDQYIRKQTGNEVYLLPIEFEELRVVISNV